MILEYPNMIEAEAAAEYLQVHGVPARAWSHNDPWKGDVAQVHIEDVFKERTKTLLAEFKKLKPELDPDWEDQSRPDLSLVPPVFQPKCPACSALLPLDDSLTACPACRATVDVVECIIDQFGPNALSACYPQEGERLAGAVVDEAQVCCPGCGYLLRGLAPHGTCPECGRLYSKENIILGDSP